MQFPICPHQERLFSAKNIFLFLWVFLRPHLHPCFVSLSCFLLGKDCSDPRIVSDLIGDFGWVHAPLVADQVIAATAADQADKR